MNEKIVTAISLFSRLITESESKAKSLFDVSDLTPSQLNYLKQLAN